MPYKISGVLGSATRILLLDEATGILERTGSYEAGSWEILADDENKKMVIAREPITGESYGYGYVTPLWFATTGDVLAIDTSDNLFAVNTLGDQLSLE